VGRISIDLALADGCIETFFVKTNCNLDPAAPNAPPIGDSACGPASSNVAPTPNTNPTDVFSATISTG
jgi:hypothetical protein